MPFVTRAGIPADVAKKSTDEYRARFSEWFLDRLQRHKGRPLVVYCPDYAGTDINPDEYISSILKPALGFEIRLE